jgi:mannose-6-phosphate isomerase-like protein (cupin superfamily)
MKLIFSSLLCGFLTLFGSEQAPVPVAKEPNHHLKLENSSIRVYDVVVPPGGATLMHVHGKDYFFANFGDATLKNQAAGQPEQDLNLKDGEARYTPATVTHRIRNIGKTPFHNLTVELLQPPSANAGRLTQPGENQTVVVENERIRAIRALLQPGESTGIHSHPQHTLMIMVDSGSVRIDVPGQKPQEKRVKPGEFAWQETPPTHSLANSGKTPVRIIEVEVK